jgi:hypothetical protein
MVDSCPSVKKKKHKKKNVSHFLFV